MKCVDLLVISLVGSVVTGSVVGSVMTISGGHVAPLPKKVTSARNTQSEPGESLNRRASNGIVVMLDKHTRTKEVQDVILTLAFCSRTLLFSSACTVCTPIPHCGQLNITTSILSTLLKHGVSRKSKMMSVLDATCCLCCE